MTLRSSRRASGPVLAIALDATEARLVRALTSKGRLPTLAALLAEGRSGVVRAPADIGSGAVWPTFMTGLPPDAHGLFGEFAWHADTMRLARPSASHLVPFWRQMAEAGRRVTVLDVPFAPVQRHERLVEIADWGAHDWFGAPTRIEPAELRDSIAEFLEPKHPLVAGRVDSDGPGDVDGLKHVVEVLRAGVVQRGRLAERLFDLAPSDLYVLTFTEVHRASHVLWHTLDATHPAWREGLGDVPDEVMGGLGALMQAVDHEIGRLVARLGDDATVVVFALHGMQPTRGIPAFLNDVLEHWGFAAQRRAWQQSPRELLGAVVKTAKGLIPASAKAAYYRRVPKSVTLQLAQPSMPTPPWDWNRTRAFSLPTDQHGWIRLNLAGREAGGIVDPSAYEATCVELASRLSALRSPAGPLVANVVLTAEGTGRPPRMLPDLVVHWTPETWRRELTIVDPPMASTPVGLKFTGQHDLLGFYIGRGPAVETWPEEVEAASLGARFAEAIGLGATETVN